MSIIKRVFLMRILVLSDSHGNAGAIKSAILYNNPDAVIFLGDGLLDWEENLPFIKCPHIAVRGNCDFYFDNYPVVSVENLFGKTVYCTHGFKEGVKYSIEPLKKEALKNNADIVLFGHTHRPFSSYDNGLYIMNPGSASQNSCGVIDIMKAGILSFTKNIENY